MQTWFCGRDPYGVSARPSGYARAVLRWPPVGQTDPFRPQRPLRRGVKPKRTQKSHSSEPDPRGLTTRSAPRVGDRAIRRAEHGRARPAVAHPVGGSALTSRPRCARPSPYPLPEGEGEEHGPALRLRSGSTTRPAVAHPARRSAPTSRPAYGNDLLGHREHRAHGDGNSCQERQGA